MRAKFLVIGIALIILMGLASATTTTLNGQTSFEFSKGDSSTILVSYSINNQNGNAGQKGVSLTGSPLFISYSGGSVSFGENTTTNGNLTLNLNIPSNTSGGNYVNSISIDSQTLNFNIKVLEGAQPGEIIVFPTSKIVNVKLDQTKTQNIQLIVPSSYGKSILVQSVSFNPDIDVVQFGDLDLGALNPGQTLNIPIIINANDVQTGTYSTKVRILATDLNGQVSLPDVNLEVTVSATTSPATGTTFSSPPSCSLSSTALSLNNSYIFTCSNVDTNIEVSTPFSPYFIGEKVEIGSGIYTYTFKPIKAGNTQFIADFNYRGFSVFNQFVKDITIQGVGVSGTNLKIIFTPNQTNIEPNKEVRMQLVNDGGSLVDNPELYINAVVINGSGKSFSYIFETDKDYEIRGASAGYNNIVQNFRIQNNPLNITLPNEIFANSPFFVTTDITNFSVFVDGTHSPYPITIISPGSHTLEFKKEGFTNLLFNITVLETIGIKINPSIDDLKLGKDIVIELTKLTDWRVTYDDQEGTTPQEIARGKGDLVNFEIKKAGLYRVYADDKVVWSQVIIGKSWYKKIWVWALLIFLIGGFFLFLRANKNSVSNQVGYS